MRRRDFFKVLTGYVAVAFAFGVSAKAKSETKTLFCKGKDYPEDVPIPAEIPTEWAKQEPLTVDEIMDICRKRLKEPKKHIVISTPNRDDFLWRVYNIKV